MIVSMQENATEEQIDAVIEATRKCGVEDLLHAVGHGQNEARAEDAEGFLGSLSSVMSLVMAALPHPPVVA